MDKQEVKEFEEQPTTPIESPSGEDELPELEISGEDELPEIEFDEFGDEEFPEEPTKEPTDEEPTDEEPEEADEEFFLDEEEIEIIEPEEGIAQEIIEEVALPEYKIIATEEEQTRDAIEDYVRKLSENKKNNDKELQKIYKKIEHFTKLKHTFSEKKNDTIVGPSFKTSSFRPIIKEILDGTFDNQIIVPVVSGQKILYEHKPMSEKEIPLFSKEDINEKTNVVYDNLEQIVIQEELREKYSRGIGKLNYSLTEELKETFPLYNSTLLSNSNISNGFPLKLKKRTEALVNIFQEEPTKFPSKMSFASKKFVTDVIDSEDVINKTENMRVEGLYRKEVNEEPVLFRDNLLNMILKEKEYVTDYSKGQTISLQQVFKVGDNIRVCIPSKNKVSTIRGSIEEIRDKQLIVKGTNDEKETKLKSLSINLENSSLVIARDMDVVLDNNRNCSGLETTLYKFPSDEQLTRDDFTKFVKESIPSHKLILYSHFETLENMESFNEVNTLLKPYHSSYDHLVHEDVVIIRKFIQENNNAKVKEFQNRVVPKEIKSTNTKRNFRLLNRSLLDKFSQFYGIYPHYNTSVDSDLMRLKWLHSRHDQGLLFYRTISLDMSVAFYRSLLGKEYELATFISSLKGKLKQFEDIIKPKIERDMLKQSGTVCPEKRVVKEYHSIQDLEGDFNKALLIDEHLLHYNENKESYVQLGHYALLYHDDVTSVFQRSEVSGQQMWIKTDDTNGGHLLQSNVDFCNNQGKSLKSLNVLLENDKTNCVYNELLQSCIGKSYYKDIQNYYTNKESLKQKENMLYQVDHIQELREKLEKDIFELEDYSKLVLAQQVKKIEKIDKADIQVQEKEQQEQQYGELYRKIDAYLKKINKLPDLEKYPLMVKLFELYGRHPNSKENVNNIYCKVGKKVLFCKHHLEISDYFKSKSQLEQKNILQSIIDKYAVESEGTYYCTNCGQDIYVGEFETVEGFLSSGAHNVTTEELDTEDSTYIQTKNDHYSSTLLELLENEEHNDVVKDKKYDILEIQNKLLHIYGIELKDTDKIALFKLNQAYNNSNVKSYVKWYEGLNPKQKQRKKSFLNMVYETYKNKEVILNIASHTFLYLQTMIPHATITKGYKSISLSLEGEPLYSENKKGIQSMSSILQSLGKSGSSLWEPLSKGKISSLLETKIMNLSKNIQFNIRIQDKLKFMEEKKEIHESGVNNKWNEFRPPITPFKINLEDFKKTSSMKKEEHKFLVALKTIETANNIISSSSIVNRMNDPLPLANSCCLQKLGKDFHIRSYFDKESDDLITKAVKELEKSYPLHKGRTQNKSFFVFKDKYLEPQLESFMKDIGSSEFEHDEKLEFYLNTVTNKESPHFGKKHIYDKDGICILTGEKRTTKQFAQISDKDYEELITEIYKKNMFRKMENVKEDLFNPKKLLENIVNGNYHLKEDSYFNKLIHAKEINYNSLKASIKTEIMNIKDVVVKHYSPRQTKEIITFLENIGDFSKLYDENNVEHSMRDFYNFNHGCRYLRTILNVQIPTILSTLLQTQDAEEMRKENPEEFEGIIRKMGPRYKNILRHESYSVENIRYIQNLTKLFQSNLENILGVMSRLNCFNEVAKQSNFVPKDAFLIMKYIFIIYFRSLLQEKDITKQPDLPDIVEPSFLSEQNNDDLFMGNMDITKIVDRKINFFAEIMGLFLDEAHTHQEELLKHTDLYIRETLQKIADKRKEENLTFIKELSKEARQSTKVMLGLGLEKYAQLAKTREHLLLDEETINQDVDHLNPTNDILEQNNEIRFGTPMIENNDEYQRQMRIEREIYEDRDILPDDE